MTALASSPAAILYSKQNSATKKIFPQKLVPIPHHVDRPILGQLRPEQLPEKTLCGGVGMAKLRDESHWKNYIPMPTSEVNGTAIKKTLIRSADLFLRTGPVSGSSKSNGIGRPASRPVARIDDFGQKEPSIAKRQLILGLRLLRKRTLPYRIFAGRGACE
jgi:hypothetical protein